MPSLINSRRSPTSSGIDLVSMCGEGCKRLNVRLTQSGVPTSDGRSVDFGIDYGLNMCMDGSPPTEGIDLEQAAKVLELKGTTN
jgi:hypothetical protein